MKCRCWGPAYVAGKNQCIPWDSSISFLIVPIYSGIRNIPMEPHLGVVLRFQVISYPVRNRYEMTWVRNNFFVVHVCDSLVIQNIYNFIICTYFLRTNETYEPMLDKITRGSSENSDQTLLTSAMSLLIFVAIH